MSPRPIKPRVCRCLFKGLVYKPAQAPLKGLEKIRLYQDELEAMRLCDLMGLDQEAAGQKMGISRGTVQRLLTRAREKVARALVEGQAIVMTEYVE